MTKGWRNHPAVLMWCGYEDSLIEYGQAICDEWIRRGYNDTLHAKIGEMSKYFPESCSGSKREPSWLGDERIHKSHKSNLLRKDINYYSVYFKGIPADLPYFWITSKRSAAEFPGGGEIGSSNE